MALWWACVKKKKINFVSIVFFAASFIMAVAAVLIYMDYRKGEIVYEELSDSFADSDSDEDTPDESGGDIDTPFSPDWEKLKAINKDVVGWIRTATGADYPVLRGETDNTYIKTDIYGDHNVNGSIFLHYSNAADFSDRSSVIYGHNMNSGAMFGRNSDYKDESFLDKNPYFYIYTPKDGGTCTLRYRIFSIVVTEDASECYNPDIMTDAEVSEYLKTLKKHSMYWCGEPDEKCRIVSLSSCTGRAHGSQRLLVQGYLEQYTDSDGSVMTGDEYGEKIRIQQEAEMAAQAVEDAKKSAAARELYKGGTQNEKTDRITEDGRITENE